MASVVAAAERVVAAGGDGAIDRAEGVAPQERGEDVEEVPERRRHGDVRAAGEAELGRAEGVQEPGRRPRDEGRRARGADVRARRTREAAAVPPEGALRSAKRAGEPGVRTKARDPTAGGASSSRSPSAHRPPHARAHRWRPASVRHGERPGLGRSARTRSTTRVSRPVTAASAAATRTICPPPSSDDPSIVTGGTSTRPSARRRAAARFERPRRGRKEFPSNAPVHSSCLSSTRQLRAR